MIGGHMTEERIPDNVWGRRSAAMDEGLYEDLSRLTNDLARANRQAEQSRDKVTLLNAQLQQALDDLRQTQSQLIHAGKMAALGQLVAGLAHEINNPLGFIIGNLESLGVQFGHLIRGYHSLEHLIEGGTLELRASLNEIRTAQDIDFICEDVPANLSGSLGGLKRIREIVENLLTFSRCNEAARKQVALADAIHSTLALADRYVQESHVKVVTNLGDLPVIDCYPAELAQVFMNVIINAVKSMPTGGILTIEGQNAGEGMIRLSFRDTGHGIPEDIIGRIFEPFFTTAPVGSGTGLGLTISHNIVTIVHGGQIDVSSQLGVGSLFTITLPIRQPERR